MRKLFPQFKLPNNFWVWMLLFFGVFISAPRFAGAFAAAVGRDAFSLVPILLNIEVFSGIALAVFEALGYAFISHRWQQIHLFDSTKKSKRWQERIVVQNAIYWGVLAIGQLLLLVFIPVVAVGHLAVQLWAPMTIADVMVGSFIAEHALAWTWIFIVAGVQTLFVFLIGLSIERYLIRDIEEKKEVAPVVEKEIVTQTVQVPIAPRDMETDMLMEVVQEIQSRGLGQFVGGTQPPPPATPETKRVTLRRRTP